MTKPHGPDHASDRHPVRCLGRAQARALGLDREQGQALGHRRRRRDQEKRDRGAVSVFTVTFALFVILLAGLLVDGGLAIHARQRAADIAEQAARAAADNIDVTELRITGEPRIADGACARARQLVSRYPEASGAVGCVVSADRSTAMVAVTIEVELQLLSIVPTFSTFTMTSMASAEPEAGV